MEVAKGETAEKNNKEDEAVLPGFRFHPTDEELVGFYLRRKVEQKPLRIEIIKQIDIYKYDPWDLPMGSVVGDKEWYFFCIRGRKYRNSIRPNRVTGSGFWKATGIDKPIYGVKEPHECIGLKKSLVYYRGSAGKGTKTDWMMHEFRLPPNLNGKPNSHDLQPNATSNFHEAEVWTLCRIFKRVSSYRKYTPNLKDTSAAATVTKPNGSYSNSKTCSLESENNSNPYYLNFKDSFSVVQQNERKPTIAQVFDHHDQRNHLFLGQLGSIPQVPPTTAVSYPSFWNNPNGEDVFANGNWDELRSVIQFANIDPDTSRVDGL
ncbi:hypothetical protein L6164_031231 [Bauhinia variegata]|uniref:Uncharacterized protein n=1 Tax=Bauhinia variegata TaxID=167791 RepID=A0ACB9LEW2_BAUVA|nr:hypothetical protein L6164_031231 [Bauhinia variegata]